MHTAEHTASAGQREIVNILAERFDREGVRAVAERQGRIAEIGTESRRLIQRTADVKGQGEGQGYEGMIESVKGDDGASAMPPQEMGPELSEQVSEKVEKLQKERMQAVDGDTGVQARVLEEGVAGVYDGDEPGLDVDVVSNGTRREVNRVYRHERQHEKDGFSGRDIDAPLIQPTGNTTIDAALPETTERDVLEMRAMQEEGVPPEGVYVEQHWKPAVALENRIDEAGLSGRDVLRDLIEKDDVAGFERAKNAILLRQLMAASSN